MRSLFSIHTHATLNILAPDFEKMEHKLTTLQYNNVDEFVVDAQLVFNNCRKYNPSDSVYAKAANGLEKFMKDRLAAAGR